MTYETIAGWLITTFFVVVCLIIVAYIISPKKTKDVLIDIVEFLAIFFVFFN